MSTSSMGGSRRRDKKTRIKEGPRSGEKDDERRRDKETEIGRRNRYHDNTSSLHTII